mmetsp:Transcript_32760/g.110362  ORF Transcript_32760/g.110362 Transcript_32760/m.110362 type:complete len:207 (-) Transcript_32760:1753-2373(-)
MDGDKAREKKCCIGCQNQCCAHKASPAQAPTFSRPFDSKETQQLRPPASTTPAARMAPSLVNVEGYLSFTMPAIFSLKTAAAGHATEFVCIRTIAMAIKAPCRTKSTASATIGLRRACAAAAPVPAQAMPTARHAPYRTCGLNDSASRATKAGTLSGDLNITKPKHVTAARRTSSETSATATPRRRLTAWSLAVPAYARPIAYIPP